MTYPCDNCGTRAPGIRANGLCINCVDRNMSNSRLVLILAFLCGVSFGFLLAGVG